VTSSFGLCLATIQELESETKKEIGNPGHGNVDQELPGQDAEVARTRAKGPVENTDKSGVSLWAKLSGCGDVAQV